MSTKELWFLFYGTSLAGGKGKEELFSVKSLVGFKVYFSNTLHLFVKLVIVIVLQMFSSEINVISKGNKGKGS